MKKKWKGLIGLLLMVAFISAGYFLHSCKPELPDWAYGVECHICQMTFISPEAHYKYVMEHNCSERHENSITITKSLSNSLDDFAKCLTTKGLIFYGVSWCPHCANEKKLFGDSFQYVNYVECTLETARCQMANITALPTFIIDNTRLTGEQSLETLAQITGCVV